MNNGIVELDLHGMNSFQAKTFIDSRLKSAKKDIYRLRLIHGYHGGTSLKQMILKTYRNNPKVIRIEIGLNQGTTDLVLRELF
ncbi:Smr/MutS family protein [Parasporobacterium paucivorans]|uniref:Smr domain-containing protein n=1 Tax=Parasporobacterium paucivorans DSM 15970 TaxID=1122934 RepID=A0A1M6EVC9_9FIRM|nr:Smr/MutS family protein [Parasporobacterium paucivorans]SHI89405.1 Smr domain-containing protein [Parasporobacterium paucivorans DSM 15970]